MGRKTRTACRKSSGRRQNLSSGAFRSRLGQVWVKRKSHRILHRKKFGICRKIRLKSKDFSRIWSECRDSNPRPLGPEGWSDIFSGHFEPFLRLSNRKISQRRPFRHGSFHLIFPRLGHGLGQNRKSAAQKLRRCKQRIGEDYLLFSVIYLFPFCYVIIRQAHNHFLLSKDISFSSFVTLLCFQFRQQNFSNRNCVLHSQIAVCAFTYIKFSGHFKLFIRKPYLQPDRIIWQKVKYCTQIGIAVCKFCSEGFANLPNAIRCFSI